MEWDVYGKLRSVTGGPDGNIQYTYDNQGNRLVKSLESTSISDVYVRDASGNIIVIYKKYAAGDSITERVNEFDLYGSSRIGTLNPNRLNYNLTGITDSIRTASFRNLKAYELSNHLGNVLTTISDRKIGQDDIPNGLAEYYIPSVLSKSDYYPFGLEMPGRTMSSENHRFGFNGKEKDPAISSLSNYDYGFRIYNPAIGRFLSVDPLTISYPEWSPYSFAMNRPINGVDLDGKEWEQSTDESGITHIKVNVDLSTDLNLSKEELSKYKNAISFEFNEALKSSNEKLRGQVTFNGGKQVNRLIPKISIASKGESIVGAISGYGSIVVGILNEDNSPKTLEQFGLHTVHELFHTIRLEHPFEYTQGTDTQLKKQGGFDYFSTIYTDKSIYFNIMNYSYINIDLFNLKSLWQGRKPNLITKDQISFILDNINLQMEGYGMFKNDKTKTYNENKMLYTERYLNYWNIPVGTEVTNK